MSERAEGGLFWRYRAPHHLTCGTAISAAEDLARRHAAGLASPVLRYICGQARLQTQLQCCEQGGDRGPNNKVLLFNERYCYL